MATGRIGRHSWLVAGAATVAVLAVTAGAAVVLRTPADGPAARPVATPGDPDWRWESYGGIELWVPRGWTYGITDTPYCSSTGREGDGSRPQPDGEVGRPGVVPGVLCVHPVPADKRGQHVWFSPADRRHDAASTYQLGGGWVRDLVVRAGTRIDLQTRDPGVRTTVLASIREVRTDVNRCPSGHPIGSVKFGRPDRGVDWAARVTGVSICRYDRSTLYASRRLDRASGQRVLDLIEAAPPGGGPAEPGPQADPRYALAGGTVLRFDTASGVREVYVRYDFGQPYGFDNGAGRRRLTRTALAFMSGPLVVHAGPGTTMTLLPRR